ncbi:MAG: DUF4242 domain-containing protein [Candidatus Thiodiazotropha sp. (ex Notomyrtea botanica)]|nr:DUF4242 domain-containing protein [Candidatus Thiodiazotropha sp. (ex Notomyrtea botanica)]
MKPMKFFIDTHNSASDTFPTGLTPEQFESFYVSYEQACYEEEVVPLRVHVGYGEGRAFCFTMAPDAEAVRRAHEKVGLPFETITEVTTATPGDTFFRRSAA